MGTRLARILAIGILLASLVAIPRISPVAAVGQLYISPALVTPQTVNSTFSVLVKVAGVDQFNAWEIQIIYDTRVVNASGILVSGNILQANSTGGLGFETRNCVNGAGLGCCLTNACSPIDGPGIADSSFWDTRFASGSGLLFNVTFKVVSSRPYSPIIIQNDVLSNGGRSAVVHTTARGSYGIAKDFGISARPPSMDVLLGSSNTTTITLQSYDNFSGPISLAAASPGKGLTITITPNQTSLSANGTGVSQLRVQAGNSTIATSYTIILSPSSSSLPVDTFRPPLPITLSVHTHPDFNAYATPSLLLADQSKTNSTTITVASVQNFTGTVNLTVTGPADTTAHLDLRSLTIPNGGSANATLTLTTQSSILPFVDYFFVNVTNGSHFKIVQVTVQPPLGDFNVTGTPASATVQAGGTEVVNINVTSLHYFFGNIYLLGSSPSGLQITFAPASFLLNYSQTVATRITITTNATTTVPGSYAVTLTVVGQFGHATLPTLHALRVTITVSPSPPQPQLAAKAPTFLGLQESAFFGMIGGLAALLAVVGILEARRLSRPRKSSILEG